MRTFKISILTVGRSDLGIMKSIIQSSEKDKRFLTELVVGSAHNSKIFGTNYKEIKQLDIKKKFYFKFKYTDSDTKNVLGYFSKTIKEASRYLQTSRPDCVLILGDRYEALAMAITCLNYNVKVAHFCGGSKTVGSLDDKYRILISKISNFHFLETKFHKKNLIKENINKNLFVVGAPALEEIKNHNISLKKIKKDLKLNLDIKKKIIISCFHPETTITIKQNLKNLKELIQFVLKSNQNVIFTFPNADVGFNTYIKLIENMLLKKNNINLIKNLGTKYYYSLLKKSHIMVGNSSSGIIESSSFYIPVINLGNRQKDRFAPSNVFNCSFNSKLILKLNNKLLNKSKIRIKNPYFKSSCSKNVLNILFKKLS